MHFIDLYPFQLADVFWNISYLGPGKSGVYRANPAMFKILTE